jgi:peptide deformylase
LGNSSERTSSTARAILGAARNFPHLSEVPVAILPIRTFGDPVLRTKAPEVGALREEHKQLIKDMIDTMRAAPGVGLAAPQVGVLERIFVWEVEDEHGAVIDPVIVERSDRTEEEEEGCLSLPGLVFPVRRPAGVVVEGLNEHGERIRIEADDLLARVFQHEIDHLDGVLFPDRLPDDLRKEAMRLLREQALGLPSGTMRRPPTEEAL